MSLEFVDQQTPPLPSVNADHSTLAEVQNAKHAALVEGTEAKMRVSELETSAPSGDMAIGLDLAASMFGMGGLVTAINAADEIYTDMAKKDSAPQKIDGEDLVMRANLAGMSLDLDPKHDNTDAWKEDGKNQKLEGVGIMKSINHQRLMASEIHYGQAYSAELKQTATVTRAQHMAPGMSLGSGPTFRAQDFINKAEEWQEGSAG